MRNSTYSFMPIFLKLSKWFCHGLKMCIWFGYTPQINFCHVFCIWNLAISSAQILPKCVYVVGTLCAHLLRVLKLYRCVSHGMKMCMCLGYNPQIIFCHVFCIWNLAISSAQILPKCVYVVGTLCAHLLRVLKL